MRKTKEMIEIENINTPGRTSRVNQKKYEIIKKAMLEILPTRSPGFTHKEICAAVDPYLDQQHFPSGATSAWWAKTVQLDLEAKGILIREPTKPLRWYRVIRSK